MTNREEKFPGVDGVGELAVGPAVVEVVDLDVGWGDKEPVLWEGGAVGEVEVTVGEGGLEREGGSERERVTEREGVTE